jgi:hypothetical protein
MRGSRWWLTARVPESGFTAACLLMGDKYRRKKEEPSRGNWEYTGVYLF